MTERELMLEHLQDLYCVVDNMQSTQYTVEEIERIEEELGIEPRKEPKRYMLDYWQKCSE
jgi:hypothetical protein